MSRFEKHAETVVDGVQRLRRALGGFSRKLAGMNTESWEKSRSDQARLDFRLIVDSIPAPVAIMTPSGEVEVVNRLTLEYFGKTLTELKNWSTADAVHPDDLAHSVAVWRNSVETGQTFENESRHRRADGVYRWFHVNGFPLRDTEGRIVRWCVLQIDIEDRKQAEIRKAAILDSALDCIVTMDHEGRITEFNPAAEHTFGYRRDEVVGKQLADTIIPPALREQHRLGFAHYLNTGEARVLGSRIEMTAVRADGSEFPVELTITRVPLDGPPLFTGYLRDITERKQSEESFRAIVQTTPECVKIIARDGTLLRVNSAGLAMAGVDSADLVLGQSFYNFLAPEDRERYREFNERICAGKKGFLEFDIISMQGERRQMETHAAPMRHSDGSVVQLGVTRDITARKEAENKLRRSEAFLAEAQRLTRIGSFSWRIVTNEIVWSEQLYRIFGFDQGVPVTLELIRTRVHPEDIPLFEDMIRRVRAAGDDFEYEHRLLMPDRTTKYLRLIAHASRDTDGQLEYIGAALDVTQSRLSEVALAKLRSELAHVSRITSLGVLTASIAHEINQPLASITTNGETVLRWLARSEPDIEKARELIKRVVADTRRASEIIDRTRAMATRQAPRQAPLLLDDVIEESMVFLRHEFQSRSISVTFDLAKELPQIVADRTQIQQVIVNLAINAVQAMAQCGARNLLIRTIPAPETVCCNIEDSGPGIDPAHLPHLFDTFFTTKDTGMGMGLPICRSIIEAHGGQIRADNDSTLGGARFSFALPVNCVS
jgi:PAS domain S-box-containing protein